MGLESMPSIEYACEYYVLFTLFSIGCAHFNSLLCHYIFRFFPHTKVHTISAITIQSMNNVHQIVFSYVIHGNACIFTALHQQIVFWSIHMFAAHSVNQIRYRMACATYIFILRIKFWSIHRDSMLMNQFERVNNNNSRNTVVVQFDNTTSESYRIHQP